LPKVEEQTEKLVAVCRLRKILLSSLLIKWTVKEKTFDLMDEVEQKLGLTVTFKFSYRYYDFRNIQLIQNINLFSGDNRKNIEETIAFSDVQNPELKKS
jgi:peptide chain release factor 3